MDLLIELIDSSNTVLNITYEGFFIGSEIDFYQLNLGNITSGSAVLKDIRTTHNGKKFTTIDKDNDDFSGNCASYFKGGWWFGVCYDFCLTCEGTAGQYRPNGCVFNSCILLSENLKMSIIPSIL